MSSINPEILFLDLSKALCGYDELMPALSKAYYDVFNNDPTVKPILDILLSKYEVIHNGNPANEVNEIKTKILSDPALQDLVLNIIKLWYLGVIKSLGQSTLKGNGFYFHHEALIWKVAHAHPAGLSTYYGSWTYKPEN